MRHRLSCISQVLSHLHSRYQNLSELCAVDISHLGCAILDLDFTDRINMLPRRSNGSGLKGAFANCKFDGGRRRECRIYYDADLPYSPYRYVKAKEMSHLFDQPHEQTRTLSGIRDVAIFAAERRGAPTSPSVEAEEKAEHCAIELLFPFEHRSSILGPHIIKPSQNVVEVIAAKIEVPFEQVEKALSPGYHAYIAKFRNELKIENLF